VDIVTLQNPFDHLHRDSDVEGMTDGHDHGTAYGEIYGIDDASMVRVLAGALERVGGRCCCRLSRARLNKVAGVTSCLPLLKLLLLLLLLPPAVALQGWSRYAQGTRHMAFNSGLFYIKANARTIDLLTRIAGGCGCGGVWAGHGTAGRPTSAGLPAACQRSLAHACIS
jgi:hypothetical protein